MIISTKPHPLRQRADTMYFSAWRSVDALSRAVARTIPAHIIHVNGEKIPVESYDRLLYESDQVTVCGVPGAGPELTAFLISLAVSAVLTGVTIGLTFLLRPKIKRLGADTPTQGITGVGNVPDPFGAITKVYGQVRLFPKFPGATQTQYTEVVGGDQYLRFLLLVCRGPVNLIRQQLKIGETSIENFQDVEIEILEGKATDPPLTLYTRDVRETTLNIALTQAADWQQQTSELNADALSVDWAFLRGLQRALKNGGRSAISVNVQIQYSLVGSGVWLVFDSNIVFNKYLLGAWPQVPLPGPIVINSDGADTRVVTCLVERSDGQQVSIDITLNGTTLVESAEIDNTKLISASVVTPDTNRLVYLYYYQQFDPEAVGNPGYSDLIRIGILGGFETTGKTTSVVRSNHTWTVPPGQYHVRMRRTTSPGDSQDIDETTWTTLRTIRNETPVVEPNVALLAGRIRATNQLNGLIDNFSAQPQSLLRTYDGAAWTAPMLSDNPAWAVVDILTGYNENIPELSV
ncbi:MAG: hypothetical protein OEQ18_14565, partial [Gammaproteobacteria bacterium]|nr:hypothetical protein [Gammaproteobacteria bacterium]